MSIELTKLESGAIEDFRKALPSSHNLDMWVNETVLEYQRATALREQGIAAMPFENTLLSILMKIAGNRDTSPHGSGFSEYTERFGCAPDYCWTISVDEMFGKSAAAANQPATAWVAYSKLS